MGWSKLACLFPLCDNLFYFVCLFGIETVGEHPTGELLEAFSFLFLYARADTSSVFMSLWLSLVVK